MKRVQRVSAAALVVAFTGPALAADPSSMEVPLSVPTAPTADPYDWTSGHFGIIGSYNWVGTTSDDLVLYDLWPQGGSIGFRLGYDHQFANNVVVGILADASLAGSSGAQIDFTNIGGTVIVTGSQATLQAHGSVRGRLGIAIDRFMPYATGGIAWARHEVDYRQELGFPGFETNINGAQTHVGWTLGAGAEFAMTDALAVSAEYRYSDYGSKTYSGDFIGLPLESDIWLESHSLTLGLSMRF